MQLDPHRGHHGLCADIVPVGEGGDGADEGGEGVVPVGKGNSEGASGEGGEGSEGVMPMGIDKNIPLLSASVDI
jgi:hypothetical protein